MLNDTDDSIARIEQERRNQDISNYVLNIKLEIKQEADFGGRSAEINVTKHDPEFVKIIKDILVREHYSVRVEDNILKIYW